MTNDSDLPDVVRRFTESEAALRSVADRLESMDSATHELQGARTDLETIRERLKTEYTEELASATTRSDERMSAEVAALDEATGILGLARKDAQESERGIANLRTELQSLSGQLGDCARDLKSTAIALETLRPEGLSNRLREIEAATKALRNLMLLVLVALVAVAIAAVIL